MCSLFGLLLIFFFLIFLCIWWFLKYADADLTILLLEKFGKTSDCLKNKVVWITGASSGIGEAFAYRLAVYGTKLVISGTNEERLQKVKKQCLAYGYLSDNDVLIVPFNIGHFSIHEECTRRVLDHFGKIDILVNNAGLSQRADFHEIDLRVDKNIFDINVFGALNLTREVLKHFLDKGSGHVVVTSSCTGKFGVPGSASYTASKHALHGYFECLRTEMSCKGIEVTMICPGPVFSGILSRALTTVPGQKFEGNQNPKDKRMLTSRCAKLMAVAVANKVDEAWISIQPSLLLYYLSQYTPTFFRSVLVKRFSTPERAAAIREGRW